MAELALQFWNRVDDMRGDMSLKELAERAGINYLTMKGMRSSCRYPKENAIMQIAEVLNTTPDILLSGKAKAQTKAGAREGASLSPEALAVENDDRLKALVRACLRDPRLLDIISAVVESSERTLGKQA